MSREREPTQQEEEGVPAFTATQPNSPATVNHPHHHPKHPGRANAFRRELRRQIRPAAGAGPAGRSSTGAWRTRRTPRRRARARGPRARPPAPARSARRARRRTAWRACGWAPPRGGRTPSTRGAGRRACEAARPGEMDRGKMANGGRMEGSSEASRGPGRPALGRKASATPPPPRRRVPGRGRGGAGWLTTKLPLLPGKHRQVPLLGRLLHGRGVPQRPALQGPQQASGVSLPAQRPRPTARWRWEPPPPPDG